MDFVRLYDDEDLRTLPAGLWGIPEPTVEWANGKRQSGVWFIDGVSSAHSWARSCQSWMKPVETLT